MADSQVQIEFDGQLVLAHEGETVAMALFAAGQLGFRSSAKHGLPRGVFCNIGSCYECLVYLDGRAVRACATLVADGMKLHRWRPAEELA